MIHVEIATDEATLNQLDKLTADRVSYRLAEHIASAMVVSRNDIEVRWTPYRFGHNTPGISVSILYSMTEEANLLSWGDQTKKALPKWIFQLLSSYSALGQLSKAVSLQVLSATYDQFLAAGETT